MADFKDIREKLNSCISEEDPLKVTKRREIHYFWQAFSDLFRGNEDVDLFLTAVSNEACWREVETFHGVRLEGSEVGKRLMNEAGSTCFKRLFIACRCCLENEIEAVKGEIQIDDSLLTFQESLANFMLENGIEDKKLVEFWLNHNVKDFSMESLPIFLNGLKCAVETNQPVALHYFWGKIYSLPADRLKLYEKVNILLDSAIDTLELNAQPETFEFFFSLMNSSVYDSFLNILNSGHRCEVVSILLKSFHFSDASRALNRLEPDDIKSDVYFSWLQAFEVQSLSDKCLDEAVWTFYHLWKRMPVNERSGVLTKLTSDKEFHDNLLIPFINQDKYGVLWDILHIAEYEDRKCYMKSSNGKEMAAMLKKKNGMAYKKFLKFKSKIIYI